MQKLVDMNLTKQYPEDYKGPKAGESTHEEWIAVRDFNAFKYVRDFTWSYSDFDCYLYAMCEEHYKKGKKQGTDDAINAIEIQREIMKNEATN